MVERDRRSALWAAYENAAVIVAGIAARDLGRPTPCRTYDVGALVDHIVEAGRRAAALGRGRTPPPGDDSPHVALADAPHQLRLAAEDAARAWADEATLASTRTMPWGEQYSGADVVDMYVAELALHAWDLARATDQVDNLDPSLTGAALEAARVIIKPEFRDLAGPGSPFGAEVAPAADADRWERLAAFAGRNPRAALGR